MPEQIHFHLVYVGAETFQLTITRMRKPTNPIIEQMTHSQLRKSIRGMKPGSKTLKFAKTRIDCTEVPLDHVREYFKEVLDRYDTGLARGENLDARLEEMRQNIDPVEGSGSWWDSWK